MQAHIDRDCHYWSRIGISRGLARHLHGALKCLAGRIKEASDSQTSVYQSPTAKLVFRNVKEGSLALSDALDNLEHMTNRFNTEVLPNFDLDAVKNDVLDALTDYFFSPSPSITQVLKSIVFQPSDETLLANYKTADQQCDLVDLLPVNREVEISVPVALVLDRMTVVFKNAFCWCWHRPVLSLFWNASLKLLELYGAREDYIMSYLARQIQKNLSQNLVQTVQDIVNKLTTCMDSADVDSIQTVPDNRYDQNLHKQERKED